ncbi:hypothetical protein SPRG_05413 [Saprolegnia parasitica CBS 223.65]|uniref:Uncharacterized protein n=1 Tax=Saprolegnia parasitica (strain CBS 223.65) TaxID=695850 RepID=A0A067CJ42_SAPPC|nr:hypothetical protein SPRG_05413 [Saprolegnia parasitica CBS 223.65]KDO29170.1 hypothetical protein SPRG_05413 [Saprolegnia parasitica CBS 223.65]|eukprot:XP_012200048.1 hypothetical protein SPRG_05413 [Saprolegnia parasitica CBS 223.65]
MDAISQQPAVSASAPPSRKRKRNRSKKKTNKKTRPSNTRRRSAWEKLKEAREGASSPTPGPRNSNVVQSRATDVRQAPAARPSAARPAQVGSSSGTDPGGGAGAGDRAGDASPLARHYDPPPIRLRSKGNNSTKTCVEDLHMAMAKRYNMALTCTRADVDAFIVNELGLELGKGITGREEFRLRNFLQEHGYLYDIEVLATKMDIVQTRRDKAGDVRRFCAAEGLGMYHVTTAQNPGFIQHVIAVHVQRDKSEYFEDGEWHPLDELHYIPRTYIREVRRFVPTSIDLSADGDDDVNNDDENADDHDDDDDVNDDQDADDQGDDDQHVELIDLTTLDSDEDEDSDDDDDDDYHDGEE